MAGSEIKISQLPSASVLTGAELAPIVQAGSTKKTTLSDIAIYANGINKAGFEQLNNDYMIPATNGYLTAYRIQQTGIGKKIGLPPNVAGGQRIRFYNVNMGSTTQDFDLWSTKMVGNVQTFDTFIGTIIANSSADIVISLSNTQALVYDFKANYIPTYLQGWKYPVKAATTQTFTNVTYTAGTGGSGVGATLTRTVNGALTIDGQAMGPSERFLYKDSSNAAYNGIYAVVNAGGVSTPWSAVRTADFDGSFDGIVAGGDIVYVASGTVNGGLLFAVTGVNIKSVGSDNIQFSPAIDASVKALLAVITPMPNTTFSPSTSVNLSTVQLTNAVSCTVTLIAANFNVGDSFTITNASTATATLTAGTSTNLKGDPQGVTPPGSSLKIPPYGSVWLQLQTTTDFFYSGSVTT